MCVWLAEWVGEGPHHRTPCLLMGGDVPGLGGLSRWEGHHGGGTERRFLQACLAAIPAFPGPPTLRSSLFCRPQLQPLEGMHHGPSVC